MRQSCPRHLSHSLAFANPADDPTESAQIAWPRGTSICRCQTQSIRGMPTNTSKWSLDWRPCRMPMFYARPFWPPFGSKWGRKPPKHTFQVIPPCYHSCMHKFSAFHRMILALTYSLAFEGTGNYLTHDECETGHFFQGLLTLDEIRQPTLASPDDSLIAFCPLWRASPCWRQGLVLGPIQGQVYRAL